MVRLAEEAATSNALLATEMRGIARHALFHAARSQGPKS